MTFMTIQTGVMNAKVMVMTITMTQKKMIMYVPAMNALIADMIHGRIE